MIVSINQPAYLPWDGYFDRIRRSDLHVVLDHVPLSKGGYTNRTRIMQRDGRVMWLTIPVEKGRPINETRIMGDAWRDKHRKALDQAYCTLPWPWLDKGTLTDVLDEGTMFLWDGITTPTLRSSDLNVGGVKSDLVLNLCKEVGATTYLSGPHGRAYLDIPSFDKAGIQVEYHDYPVVQPVLSAVHELFA